MTDQSNLAEKTVLVGDIGGTNSRLALAHIDSHGAIQLANVHISPVQNHDSLQDMLKSYCTGLSIPMPDNAVIAVAGPVFGETINKSLSNLPWSFSISDVKQQCGMESLIIVNDFTALAASVPHLTAADMEKIKTGTHSPHAPRLVIGPGTGLGAASLIKPNGSWLPIASEGGNITLAAQTPLQQKMLDRLKQKHEYVSAETVLSGEGIVRLYHEYCAIEGQKPQGYTPEDIGNHAINGTDKICMITVQLFFSWLAVVAADLALCFCATGGVFIGGGISPKLKTLLDKKEFADHFIGNIYMREYLKSIPVELIIHPYPALLGAVDHKV